MTNSPFFVSDPIRISVTEPSSITNPATLSPSNSSESRKCSDSSGFGSTFSSLNPTSPGCRSSTCSESPGLPSLSPPTNRPRSFAVTSPPAPDLIDHLSSQRSFLAVHDPTRYVVQDALRPSSPIHCSDDDGLSRSTDTHSTADGNDAVLLNSIEADLNRNELLLDRLLARYTTVTDDSDNTNLLPVRQSPLLGIVTNPQHAHILFPSLFKMDPVSRQLVELCNSLQLDLTRAKSKLKVLQRSLGKQLPGRKKVQRKLDQNDHESLDRHGQFLVHLDALIGGSTASKTGFDSHRHRQSPRIYTDPTQCPLSMLAFVSSKDGDPPQSMICSPRFSNPTIVSESQTSIPGTQATSFNSVPPQLDQQQSNLEIQLSDLSSGTRLLVIREHHLQAGIVLPNPTTISDTIRPQHQFYRIRLNGGHQLSPPTSTNQPTSGQSHQRGRRQKRELGFYGWQLAQQAVLDVTPTSSSQVPSGTRVCAAWSDQLGGNLYPGTVVEADHSSLVRPDSIFISFDDGDFRQVALEAVRLLPPTFTNLHELAGRWSHKQAVRRRRRNKRPRIEEEEEEASGVYGDGSDDAKDCDPAANTTTSISQIALSEEQQQMTTRIKMEDTCVDQQSSSDWLTGEEYNRKKKGRIHFKSIKRVVDNLEVWVKDFIQFDSGSDQRAYIGEVRELRLDTDQKSPVVVAAWFYDLAEVGLLDLQSTDSKATPLFATDHVDENEARCVVGKVNLFASSKAAIGHATEVGRRQAIYNCQSNDPSLDISEALSGSIDRLDSTTSPVVVSKEKLFYKAGKFDPVTRRFSHLDPLIAKMIDRNRGNSTPKRD